MLVNWLAQHDLNNIDWAVKLKSNSDRKVKANCIDLDKMPHSVASDQSTLFATDSAVFVPSAVSKWTCSNFRTSLVNWVCPEITVFTLSIGAPYLLTIIVQNFDIIYSATS